MNDRTPIYRPLLLALVVAISLVACSDDDDTSTETGQLADAGADSAGDAADGEADSGRDAANDADAPDTGSDADSDGSDDDASEDDASDGGEDGGEDANSPEDCTYTPSSAFGIGETADMSGMTAQHNKWRERVGVAPLSWNTTLAASSKEYAERCVWEHSDDRSPDGGYDSVGENLAYTSQTLTAFGIEATVNLWADERYDWDYGMVIGDGTFSAYGHYTQMVWHSTVQVGCGAAYCSNVEGIGNSGTVIVCRYGPAGNYTGQPPYEASSGACLDLDNDDVFQRDDADDLDRTVQ